MPGDLSEYIEGIATHYIDEAFVKINGKKHYLWRAVDQDGEVVEEMVLLLNASSGAYYNPIGQIPGRS